MHITPLGMARKFFSMARKPQHSQETPRHSQETPQYGQETPHHSQETPQHGQKALSMARKPLTMAREPLSMARKPLSMARKSLSMAITLNMARKPLTTLRSITGITLPETSHLSPLPISPIAQAPLLDVLHELGVGEDELFEVHLEVLLTLALLENKYNHDILKAVECATVPWCARCNSTSHTCRAVLPPAPPPAPPPPPYLVHHRSLPVSHSHQHRTPLLHVQAGGGGGVAGAVVERGGVSAV